jgi:transcriptional regulator with XRE-family HTH domain
MLEVETVAPAEIKQGLKPDYCIRFQQGRKAAGISLAKVGAAAGVSLQAIGQFENGKQRLDLEVFAAACEAMKLDVRWVLFGRGEMFDGPAPVPKKGRPAKRKA